MDLRDLVRDALAAVEDAAGRERRPLSAVAFGDLAVTLRVDGRGRIPALLDMIRVRLDAPPPDAAVIDVIGALDGFGALLPPPDRRAGTVLRANPDVYYLWRDEAGGYLTGIDRRTRRGLVWFTCPDRIASWHVARPLLHAVHGLALGGPWTPIHAAAVARGGRAVLICGMSGAGKTSMALACAAAGWDYLGDDAVMVRADPPRVAALYASARLRRDTFHLFPAAMEASRGISDDAGELKAEVDMSRLRPLAEPQAEIAAVVVPQPDGLPCGLAPLRPSDTLRRLMDATRQSILGDEPAVFAKLASLVAGVPCYALGRCRDPARLDATLAGLIEGEVPCRSA
ncbi:hypothetical protein PQJ75_08080 [Rhodoplanes sp. TEM]|uniref:Serine kinase n=1 Tax=Rhodoplanes tepidamans TaxID=200616 RepID=A0ABT5J421_RHOTP|nr:MULTISPECIES: hypothetical protein [Rhodoplanes]MDC7784293.1 hypothetical protein [Rhodoplanes tepidamans]MDC7983685.1 hypothetical protein [Rhodoplanes sp. TEM]MDQ0353695.1 hypothetical protein [Rhodoplanes tepidamans]